MHPSIDMYIIVYSVDVCVPVVGPWIDGTTTRPTTTLTMRMRTATTLNIFKEFVPKLLKMVIISIQIYWRTFLLISFHYRLTIWIHIKDLGWESFQSLNLRIASLKTKVEETLSNHLLQVMTAISFWTKFQSRITSS